MMKIETPYYLDNTRISNSNIGQFLNRGPKYLRRMLDGQEEGEKGPQLERGTLIHSYLLTPEEFQKTYVVWDKSRPSSAQQEKFCQELANTLEIEPNRAILSAYQAAYSTKGKSEETMLSEGLKIVSTLKDYIDFLKLHDGRTMISPYDAQMLEKIKQNVQNHKLAWNLIWPKGYDATGRFVQQKPEGGWKNINFWCMHEFHINWEYLWSYGSNAEQDEEPQGVHSVQCKSLLDSLTLDFKNKKATIMDLKTTQKLWHFEDSIDMYDYCRQLAYYTMAVEWYLEEELKENVLEWSFEYYIIGIDTTGSYEIRVFKVEEYMVQSRERVIHDALIDISWHQMNNKWEHSRAYYEGDGSESLNL